MSHASEHDPVDSAVPSGSTGKDGSSITAQGHSPRLAEYLRGLPAGADSYPDCKVKGSIVREFLGHAELDLEVAPELPSVARALITQLPLAVAEVSTVHWSIAYLALADLNFPGNDAAVLDWAREANEQVVKSRMYRALLRVSTPALLLRGVSFRWNQLHRGSSMSGVPEGRGGTMTLTSPSGLYPGLFFKSIAGAFEAVLTQSGAQGARVSLADQTLTQTHYRVAWD